MARPSHHGVVDGPRQGVTLVSSTTVAAGHEGPYRRLHDRGVELAASLGALVRAEFVPAIVGVQPETVALLTFESRPALDRWLDSDERANLFEEMAPLTVDDRTINVVGDFAGWLDRSPDAEVRRWKQAVAVWGALVPVAAATSRGLDRAWPALGGHRRLALAAAINVVILTWLVMPRLPRPVQAWLVRQRRPAPGRVAQLVDLVGGDPAPYRPRAGTRVRRLQHAS